MWVDENSGRWVLSSSRGSLDVVDLGRELVEAGPGEAPSATRREAGQDGDDATHGVGHATRNGEPLDDRIEEPVGRRNAIALPFASLFHRLEHEERPENDVVERSAARDRAAVDFRKQPPDA